MPCKPKSCSCIWGRSGQNPLESRKTVINDPLSPLSRDPHCEIAERAALCCPKPCGPGATRPSDPKIPTGPYRPFTSDPGWSEAWWWLGVPVFVAALALGTYWIVPAWYMRYVLPEGYGLLEISHFFIPLFGLFIAGSLLMLPFVRARPFVFSVALIGALSCLYIAGEEMSWGQHFFHWNTPEYWAMVNRQEETNLHNTWAIFEKTPRSLLEAAIFFGGLGVPLAAIFYPWLRACRASLFLPADALVPRRSERSSSR